MNGHSHHQLFPTNIPLHCNICPKKPDFSDVSHLLTHIASKGHLSHYYKTKVKADHDLLSKQVVDEYDEWYEEWNVQDLMRERMSQKERKKGGANGSARNANGSRRPSVAHSTPSATARNTPLPAPLPSRRPYPFRESTLDPQLDRIIKQEPKSRSTTPAASFALDPAAVSRQYAPPMQTWPGTPYIDSPMTQDTMADSLYSDPSTDSMEDDMPVQAPRRRSRRNQGGSNQGGSNQGGSNQSHAGAEDDGEESGEGKAFPVKGLQLPGMGSFDSATEDGQRKRNQKKHVSVVGKLMASSEEIEPIEYVFVDFVLTRRRPITGNPEEDDGMEALPGEEEPVPDVSQPKKKKKAKKTRSQARTALANRDPNTNRLPRLPRRRGEAHHPAARTANRRGPYYHGSDGTDEEMSYGKPVLQTRSGTSIHLDHSGPDITFDNQASLNTLTSRFQHPNALALPHRGQSVNQAGYASRHGRQPSLSVNGGFRPATTNGQLSGFAQPSTFPTFGVLNGAHNIFQNGPIGLPNGQPAVNPFEDHGNFNMFGAAGNMYPMAGNGSSQHATGLDIFGGFGAADMGFSGSADGNFPVMNDATMPPMNPLFLDTVSAAQENVGPEDDDATVSPPSQH